MGIFDELYEFGKKRVKQTVWVFSDLQQARYENAKKCLDIALEDYELLGKPADMIWYLGDSTESANYPELKRMADLQIDAFEKLKIPLCYATGNHDYDYPAACRKNGTPFCMPFYDAVRQHGNWYTTKNCDETWFKVPLGNYTAYFFCDHVAKDNSWCSTHNGYRYGKENYPYTAEHFASIRKDMEACTSPNIITASHYAFPGGNRDTALLSLIQPLPQNVRLHLYGHSHIGEYNWPGSRVFSQIQWIDWQDIPQVDVSSFEDIRGSYCRSVMLQIYDDDTLGLFFRNQNEHRFVSAFFPSCRSAEKPGGYDENAEKVDPASILPNP